MGVTVKSVEFEVSKAMKILRVALKDYLAFLFSGLYQLIIIRLTCFTRTFPEKVRFFQGFPRLGCYLYVMEKNYYTGF